MPRRSIRCVGLVLKPDRPEALRLARALSRWLRSAGRSVLAVPETASRISAEAVSREQVAERSDLIVVLGGDGTLLGVARLLIPRAETPILGVNLGGLGFLTEITIEEATSTLRSVIEGHYRVDRRIALEAGLLSAEHPRARPAGVFHALNDVVINKGPLGRMLELEVSANRRPFCSYRADGLIIATPTGSTAYALSAGGPIVFPTLEVIVLAPICPHTLSNRPVVLPDSIDIEVRVRNTDHDAMITVDGQESATLSPTDVVRIRRGRHPVALVRSSHPYFEIWRDKLRWG